MGWVALVYNAVMCRSHEMYPRIATRIWVQGYQVDLSRPSTIFADRFSRCEEQSTECQGLTAVGLISLHHIRSPLRHATVRCSPGMKNFPFNSLCKFYPQAKGVKLIKIYVDVPIWEDLLAVPVQKDGGAEEQLARSLGEKGIGGPRFELLIKLPGTIGLIN